MRAVSLGFLIVFFMGGNIFAQVAPRELIYFDASKDFENQRADENIYPLLRDYRVLLLAGFGSDLIIKAVPQKHVDADYTQFGALMESLKKAEVEFKRVELKTEQPPNVLAKEIRDEIESSTKKVILVTHSKGGLDVMATLLKYPELADCIAGWIPIQVPFQGSPIADYVLKRKTLAKGVKKILEVVAGDAQSVKALSTEFSVQHLKENEAYLIALSQKFPIVAVGSYKKNKKRKWDTLMESSRNFIDKLGLENDGLVPWKSAIFPAGDFVLVEDADHLDPIQNGILHSFNRSDFNAQIFGLLLSRIDEK